MPNPSTLVHLDSVSVRVGAVRILHDVDLEVRAGDAVGVFGANGAGKTTLLRLVGTLIRPAEGAGSVLGADLGGDERFDVRPRIGYVGHVPGLYPELTLEENLGFIRRAVGTDTAGMDPGQALEAVGLGGARDRRADTCSHGMQRRAEFARVLMTAPDLLLLDEPHSALDEDAVDLVEAIVGRTTSNGGAAILVSHDQSRVASMATRTLEVTNGGLR